MTSETGQQHSDGNDISQSNDKIPRLSRGRLIANATTTSDDVKFPETELMMMGSLASSISQTTEGDADADEFVAFRSSADWINLLRLQRGETFGLPVLKLADESQKPDELFASKRSRGGEGEETETPAATTTTTATPGSRFAALFSYLKSRRRKRGEEGGPNELVGLLGETGFRSGSREDDVPSLLDVSGEMVAGDRRAWSYMMELGANIFNYDPANVRGKQARLTMWEALEMFDFVSDAFFIFRVVQTTWLENATAAEVDARGMSYVGHTAAICLGCIYVISLAGYATRRFNFYNRIVSPHSKMFVPFVCFKEIRSCGETNPGFLYMFERLIWTYQFSIRIIEDIPQLIVSTIFMATYGRTFHTYFIIAYSLFMMSITSYRMGVMFPFFGTLSLMLSRRPPIDSPDILEAAHTTRAFALFMAFNFFCWTVAHLTCAHVCRRRLSAKLFMGGAGVAAVCCVICLVSWGHLVSQAWVSSLDANEDSSFDKSTGSSLVDPHDDHTKEDPLRPRFREMLKRGLEFSERHNNVNDYTKLCAYNDQPKL